MSKFKVGDKVRVTECFHGHGFYIGEVVEIVIVDGDYHCSNGSNYWYLCASEFELYEEKETEMTLTNSMTAEQIRNEILRIGVRIEEAKKDIENAEKERDSLVEKLREKGFELSSKMQTGDIESVSCTIHNVKKGHVLILTKSSWNDVIPIGSEVRVLENDFSSIPLRVQSLDGLNEDWTKIDTVKFK